MTILKNESISVEISDHGAELKSIKKGEKEYMWQADPAFWGRTSPVLFPFVGAVCDKTYRVKGKSYAMGQHGFARDMDFELVESSDDRCTFSLRSNEETKEKYPYDFEIRISYVLMENSVKVVWRVLNTGNEDMFFSIGAHPAFNATFGDSYLVIERKGQLLKSFDNTVFGAGVLTAAHKNVELPDGQLHYTEHTFDGDAYVLEDSQADAVTLFDKGEKKVRVDFSAPLLGLWAPVGKPAPFMCIEPWYGCADTEGFCGDISERKWENRLKVGDAFEAEYRITVY